MRVPEENERASDALSLNLTGMIDVVFLLLIFFILTMTFIRPREWLPTPINLPGNVEAALEFEELDPDEPVVIVLKWQGFRPEWRLAGRVIQEYQELQTTLSALAELDASLRIILDIDGDAPLGHGIDLYDACRWAGFRQIQFSADVTRAGLP